MDYSLYSYGNKLGNDISTKGQCPGGSTERIIGIRDKSCGEFYVEHNFLQFPRVPVCFYMATVPVCDNFENDFFIQKHQADSGISTNSVCDMGSLRGISEFRDMVVKQIITKGLPIKFDSPLFILQFQDTSQNTYAQIHGCLWN